MLEDVDMYTEVGEVVVDDEARLLLAMRRARADGSGRDKDVLQMLRLLSGEKVSPKDLTARALGENISPKCPPAPG